MARHNSAKKRESIAPPPQKQPPEPGPIGMLRAPAAWANVVEHALFFLASAFALWLLVILYRCSGAIWRDEANVVLLATVPDFSTMFAWLSKDTAPPLSHLLLRSWVASGLGGSESGVRLYGIVIFVLLIVSLYFSCRSLTGRAPIVALALIVFNATVFYYATSLRSYGLAMVLILPCYAAFWRFAEGPTRWNTLSCIVFALLACQAGYLNAYPLFGIGIAAASLCAVRRLWKRAVAVLAMCALAAASLFPYAAAVREYEQVCIITKAPLDLRTILSQFCQALAGDNAAALWAWIVLGVVGVAALIIQAARRGDVASAGRSLSLYFLIAMPITFVVGTVFFKLHEFFPSAWHFTPYILLAGLGVEVSLGKGSGPVWMWLGRLAAFAAVMCVSVSTVWTAARLRRTNLDCACDELAKLAAPGDLVLITPFWLAPGFKYHYHGRAEWNTIPLTSSELESALFPYPAFKKVMETPNAIEPTLRKIAETLSSGKRLWIYGGLQFLPPNMRLPDLAPAPDPKYGWNNCTYSAIFTIQASEFIKQHCGSAKEVPVNVSGLVNPHAIEDYPLLLIEGWHTP
jgi:hypothetical protein